MSIYMTEVARCEQMHSGGAGGVYTLVRAHSDGFVWHRKTIRHNSYSILAAKRSEHESVHAA